jgi:hypothetical protein
MRPRNHQLLRFWETALSYADLANISANVALTLFEQALQPGARSRRR